MKKVLYSLLLGLFGFIAFSTNGFAEHAPGVYVTPTTSNPSDIIMTDWSAVDTTPFTYWAVHNWGGEGQGYAGFQQRTDKRTLHFSIWDPKASKDPIKAEYLDSDATAEKFDGEGTGIKVVTTYPWELQHWYTMVMRSWNENSHTKVGQWIHAVDGAWKQTAILDFPVANIHFNYGQMMFQEDWAGTADNKRSFRLKNGYGRNLSDKKWTSWNTQKVENQHGNDKNWDGGATNEYFWAQAGGGKNSTIGKGQTFTINQSKEPKLGQILLDDFKVKVNNSGFIASWKLKPTSTPQFKASIQIKRNGNIVKKIEDIQSYKNAVTENFTVKEKDQFILTITDLFDQKKEFYYN